MMYAIRIVLFYLVCKLAVSVGEPIHPLSDEFIDLINKEANWKAGRNFPPDTPIEYLRNLVGTSVNLTELKKAPTVTYDADVIDNLPESFDAREKWPNCPTIYKIRDQGQCGSCWAFGGIEMITDRVCTYSNGTKNFHFSTEDVLTCNDRRMGCNGGSLVEVVEHWVKKGIVSGGNYGSNEGCRPYSIPHCEIPLKECLKIENSKPTPPCLNSCREGYNVSYENDKKRGKSWYPLMGEENIMAELYTNGPVLGPFVVYEDFVYYKNGVYNHVKGQPIGGHAVKLIGWGVEDGTKYWLAANSWGAKWGDGGFFKFLRRAGELTNLVVVAGVPLLEDY